MAGAANAPGSFGKGQVFMYWQRVTPKATARECSNCPAMAFKNGNCVGCGTPYDPEKAESGS